MVLWRTTFVIIVFCHAGAVHYPNAGSDVSEEDIVQPKLKPDTSQQQEIDREADTDKSEIEKLDDKSVLQEALNIVLSPEKIKEANNEDGIRVLLDTIATDNQTLDHFMLSMDNLSEDICKRAQDALWAYVNDMNNEDKKKTMLMTSRQDDEVKWAYWNMMKTKYLSNLPEDPNLYRKLRTIKERGINILNPNSQAKEVITNMQRTWNSALICAYNTSCGPRQVKMFGDIISIFKSSRNHEELLYYWKAFRDSTGMKIRPIFNDYIKAVNEVAKLENFSDAGDLWRFFFDDLQFKKTVTKLWHDIKPLYANLTEYVREKLKSTFGDHVNDTLPEHLLGNVWGQEWQSLYPLLAPFPELKFLSGVSISSRSLFDDVDDFYQSMGFQTLEDAYSDVDEYQKPVADCLPSSHDMCDGYTFRIKWCGKPEPAVRALSRAASLLGQAQYSTHYSHLPIYFRSGPTPAFKIAIPNIVSTQLTSPLSLKRLKLLLSPSSPELHLNHLLWVALEKLPLAGYAFVLDTWRWNVFAGHDRWNKHWWELRLNATGVTAPVRRDKNDLDPASKYHVVTHMPYITYLISEILEFQILLALCKATNHSGPLHKCSLYGSKDAGNLLSKGMRLGARRDWRTVLRTVTGDTELSSAGILEYFRPLQDFLARENEKVLKEKNDKNSPLSIILGVVLVAVAVVITVIYLIKKNGLGSKLSGVLGISQNGSLDIATTEMRVTKVNESTNNGVCEAKV